MENMIDSYTATSVIILFLGVFGVLIPILDRIPKIKDFISLRWVLVVTYSSMCIGVIIDFSHLDNSVRLAVVIGGIILSSLFMLVRTVEKAMVNRWRFPKFKGGVAKGDMKAVVSVNPRASDSSVVGRREYVSSEENIEDTLSISVKDRSISEALESSRGFYRGVNKKEVKK